MHNRWLGPPEVQYSFHFATSFFLSSLAFVFLSLPSYLSLTMLADGLSRTIVLIMSHLFLAFLHIFDPQFRQLPFYNHLIPQQHRKQSILLILPKSITPLWHYFVIWGELLFRNMWTVQFRFLAFYSNFFGLKCLSLSNRRFLKRT